MGYVVTLGGYLRNELQRRDWSPEEFARRCTPPLSTTLIYKVMGGEDNLKLSTLKAMAGGLGLTPLEFMAAFHGGHQLTPDELAMLSAYRRVARHKRDTALDLLYALGVGSDQKLVRPKNNYQDQPLVKPTRTRRKQRMDPTAVAFRKLEQQDTNSLSAHGQTTSGGHPQTPPGVWGTESPVSRGHKSMTLANR